MSEAQYPEPSERAWELTAKLLGDECGCLPCGHPKSDETSADGYTFCAVCAVQPKPVMAAEPTCEPGCICGDVTLCGTADPDLLSVCPKCGALVEDLDGFGVLAHLAPDPGACGYCSHFDVYGDECRVCGATVGASA